MSKIAKNFLIIIVLILSINSCTKKQETILGSENQNGICIYLDGNDLKYDTDIPIAGFQFNHNGCILNISGGDAADNDFTLSSSGSAALGFSFSGNSIPEGSGILVSLEGEVNIDCMSEFVFSDSDGGSIDLEISDTPCTTLSLMTWNIENFPKSGIETINHVSRIIKEYNPDIVALQEMPDDINHEGITLLKNELTDYNLVLGNSSFATLAFLYKENSLLSYVGHSNMFDDIGSNTISYMACQSIEVHDINQCTTLMTQYDCMEADDHCEWNDNFSECEVRDCGNLFSENDCMNTSHCEWSEQDTYNAKDAFVREPLVLHLKLHNEDLYVINNHFKCCGDRTIETDLLYECDADEKRYLEASDCTTNCSDDCFDTYDENYRRLLSSQYIQQNYSKTNKNVIFLGDLNDELTDDVSDNVFYDLISDPSFQFADMEIAEGLSDYWSFPSYPSHIDHILVTSNLIGALDNPETSIFVPTVDLDFMNWEQYDFLVSDHRPVILNLAY